MYNLISDQRLTNKQKNTMRLPHSLQMPKTRSVTTAIVEWEREVKEFSQADNGGKPHFTSNWK